ncbi:MAG: hypothetical protein WBA97_07300 [Actinophytocola sp.]|uniref:hypothetical protein n=1 Tax=Actinophytocola sp. TaxID=1872138 RepID=UPI003C75D4A7
MTAREVPVLATATIGHRAYHLCARGDGFVAVSADGDATVLDGELRVVGTLKLGGRVGDVAITPDGTTWAWAADGRLWLGEPGGQVTAAPLAHEASCRWLPSGQEVWVAAGTGDEVRVEIRDPDHHVRATVTVPDEFGGAMVLLCAHPADDAAVLWVAAGQDGQEAWLLTDGGAGIRAERLPVDECRPPLFLPDGRSVVLCDDDRMVLLSWPDGSEPRTLTWAEVDQEAAKDYRDGPGEVIRLTGDHVAWTTGNGRIRVVDLTTMTVVDEIVLAGHPVRTVAELYGGSEDRNPCTDFEYAVHGAGGTVLSVHGQDTLVLSALRDWSPA